jgi:hypothetical protein
MTDNKIVIGNGQGFWGDSAAGPVQLVERGPLHYLTLDGLISAVPHAADELCRACMDGIYPIPVSGEHVDLAQTKFEFESTLDLLLDAFERLHDSGWTSRDRRRTTARS